jgi:hypothetical protein
MAAGPPTFSRDVMPVLQKHCQECHRPGALAPMSLMTYQQARPWAKAIRESVRLKRMPPWFADPAHGKFANDRSLSDRERETLLAWVEAGAPEGDPNHLPPPRTFASGWQIGEPDVVLGLAKPFPIPAEGEIPYNYIKVPTGFTEDKWIQSLEFQPGDPKVVHHVVLLAREPGARFMAKAAYGEPLAAPDAEPRDPAPDNGTGRIEGNQISILGTYVPGQGWQSWPEGQAKRIKAGSDLVFQMHYTTYGKETSDQTRVGFRFAARPPREEVRTLFISNRRLRIPPGAADHKVEARVTLPRDLKITGLFPHMHVRGKAFEYRANLPDGRSEILLRVPNYDFNWQLYYYLARPMLLPKGTEFVCTAWFDNSSGKPGNPDPTAEVLWGPQSWEEMLAGFFDIATPVEPPGTEPRSGAE